MPTFSGASAVVTGANPTVTVPVGATVTAGSFTVGNTYKILTVGTTSFTSIGASANTVGIVFVATDVGTGTGTASEYPASSDLLILITTGTATPTTPTGWTSFSAQGAGQFITVLYKFAVYLETTSVAVTLAGTTSKSVMLWYTGAGGLELASTYSTGTSTAPTTGTQTTRVDADEILSIYANLSGAARTFTPNANTTSLVNSATTTTVQGLLIASETKSPAGLTTARAATLSASSTWAGVSISVRNKLDLYWTGTGNWSSTTLWKQSSSGGPAFGPPSQNDNVYFDVSSTSCTIAAAAVCNSFNTGGFTGTFAGTSTLSVYGNWAEDGTIFTSTYSGTVTFAGSAATITNNTISAYYGLNNTSVTFNAIGGNWLLGYQLGATQTGKTLTLTAGSFNLNNQACYFATFVNTGTATRSITGGGYIYLNGSATTVINVANTGLTTINTVDYIIQRATAGAGTRTVTLGTGYNESNAPNLNVYSAADTVSITATSLYSLSFTDSGLSATPSTISNTVLTLYGSLYINTASVFTFTAGTNTWTFTNTGGGQGLNTGGKNLDFPITFNGVGGSWTIDTLLMTNAAGTAATKALTLTAGTITLLGPVTCGTFLCSGTGVRTIDGNGGNPINVSSSNTTVIDFTTITNLTIQNGPRFVTNSLAGTNFTGTRTIVGNTGFTASNAPLLDVYGYNDTVSITGAWSYIGFYDGATTTASTISNNALTFYGNITNAYVGTPLTLYVTSTTAANFTAGTNTWTFAGTVSSLQITTSGKTLDFPITFNGVGGGWVMNDTLTSGATRTVTLTNGSLDLNSFRLTCGVFSSNNSNTRTLAFGASGDITVASNSTTVVDMATMSNLTVTGTPLIRSTYSGALTPRTINMGNTAGASEANAISVNITAGTDTVAFGANGSTKDLNFTGFSGTLSNVNRTIYGGLTISSGMTLTAGTATVSFAATSGTKNITTAAKTLDFPVSFSGLGGTFALQDALTLGATRALTFTAGTLQLKASTTSTVGSFITSGTTLKYLRSTTSGTQATISDASGTNTVTYLDLKDSAATGGATWDASSPTNVDSGNNTGWTISGGGVIVTLTNVTGTTAVGTISFLTDQIISVTKVTGTSAVGTVSVSVGTGIIVTPTNVTGTGAVGTVSSITGTAVVTLTKVTGTGTLSSVSVAAGGSISIGVTNVTGITALGSVTVGAGAGVSVTNVTGTTSLSSVTVTVGTGIIVALTNVTGTVSLGSVTVGAGVGVSVTKVTGTSALGIASASISTTTSVTGLYGFPYLGNVVVSISINANPTGVSATSAVGTISSVTGTAEVYVSRVSGYGSIGQCGVWADIVPTSSTTWTDVSTL